MRRKEGDQKESNDGGPIQCLNCRKKGHLSKNCCSKLRNMEKAHVADDVNITHAEVIWISGTFRTLIIVYN